MMDLFYEYVVPLIFIALKVILIVLPLLLSVAYLTYAERRVIGLMQMRRGPNRVGPFGLLQPIADAVKLIFKETIVPTPASKIVFMIAPMITFILSLVGWAVIPFSEGWVLSDMNVGVLYVLAVSSLGVYGIIMAGWASNSKYAFLGAIRSSAQMISYEVSMGLVIVTVLLVTGSLNLSEIVEHQRDMPFWIHLLLAPMAVVFFISVLAVTVTFFMGGYLPPFGISFLYLIPGFIWFVLKICFLLFVFLWIRATLPRYRYDQLMHLGWKVFLPLSLFWVVLVASLLLITGNLP